MSVGETVLKSAPLLLDAPASSSSSDGGLSPGSLPPQPPVQQLVATPQLLCTGEVEDVRGAAGTFPPALDPAKQSIYHPKGARAVPSPQRACPRRPRMLLVLLLRACGPPNHPATRSLILFCVHVHRMRACVVRAVQTDTQALSAAGSSSPSSPTCCCRSTTAACCRTRP